MVKFSVNLFALAYGAAGAYVPQASKGCSNKGGEEVNPGEEPKSLSIDVKDDTQDGGKASRSYYIQLPEAYNHSNPAMLIWDLHGH